MHPLLRVILLASLAWVVFIAVVILVISALD